MDEAWCWTKEHSDAFTRLKNRFIEVVTLRHLMADRGFKVQTDASDQGLGGILYQTDDDGNQLIVSIVSRGLIAAELNYTTTEKELLAIIYSVHKFRYFLIGTKFEIITDHKCLMFLNTTPFLTARLARWSLILQEFTFTVTHCKGTDNIVADFISRNPDGRFHAQKETNKFLVAKISQYCMTNSTKFNIDALTIICSLKIDKVLCSQLKNMKTLQNTDAYLKKFLENVHEGGRMQKYDDILFHRNDALKNWCVVIPKILQMTIVKEIHEKLGHAGVYKTIKYLTRFFYWRGLNRDVKRIVLSCDLCQRTKCISYSMEGQYQMVKSENPGELVTVDFYGPLPTSIGGVQYLFVMVDAFSKLVTLYAIKRATTKIVLSKIINNYIPRFGKPIKILADNGTQFTSPIWGNTLTKLGIKTIFSSIRHPQSNPTERIMRELGRLFRTFCAYQHTKWSKYVSEIETLLNIMTHSSTGFSPYELHHGCHPREKIRDLIKYPPEKELPRDAKLMLARRNLTRSFQNRAKQQKSISKVQINIGDKVLIRIPRLSNAINKMTHKFFHLYEGPYVVKQASGVNAFQLVYLDDPRKIKGVFNRVNLRVYRSSMFV